MTEPGHGDRPHPRERGVLIATVTASHLTRGTGLGQRFWAFPRDPTDPRSRCSTAKAQQKQQNIEHSAPPRQGKAWQDICSSTGGSPCAASLWNGTQLMDILRAGKGLVLVRCGRMGRKRFCEPAWRVLGRNLALPTSTPSSCSLGKAQPRVSWSELHSAALSSMTGLKTHSPPPRGTEFSPQRGFPESGFSIFFIFPPLLLTTP